ncbi:MAG: hypothetical protein HZB76_02530 [Chlamydiae bacterium]|nr:hypothetical protein [Chlamydiota bacterium]
MTLAPLLVNIERDLNGIAFPPSILPIAQKLSAIILRLKIDKNDPFENRLGQLTSIEKEISLIQPDNPEILKIMNSTRCLINRSIWELSESAFKSSIPCSLQQFNSYKQSLKEILRKMLINAESNLAISPSLVEQFNVFNQISGFEQMQKKIDSAIIRTQKSVKKFLENNFSCLDPIFNFIIFNTEKIYEQIIFKYPSLNNDNNRLNCYIGIFSIIYKYTSEMNATNDFFLNNLKFFDIDITQFINLQQTILQLIDNSLLTDLEIKELNEIMDKKTLDQLLSLEEEFNKISGSFIQRTDKNYEESLKLLLRKARDLQSTRAPIIMKILRFIKIIALDRHRSFEKSKEQIKILKEEARLPNITQYANLATFIQKVISIQFLDKKSELDLSSLMREIMKKLLNTSDEVLMRFDCLFDDFKSKQDIFRGYSALYFLKEKKEKLFFKFLDQIECEELKKDTLDYYLQEQFNSLLANGHDFEAGQNAQQIHDADLKEYLLNQLYDYRLERSLICY